MHKKSFYSMVISAKKSSEKKGDKMAMDFLKEIVSYVSTGSFSSNKKAGELSKMFFDSAPDAWVSTSLGISESTVRAHRRNLSNELYSLFGEDFFSLFNSTEENKGEILRRIYIVENMNAPMEEKIIMDALMLVKKSIVGLQKREVDTVSLSSCGREVKFLQKYSRVGLKRDFEKLNPEKLAYVVSVMGGSAGSTEERFGLLKSIMEVGGERV